MRILNVTQTYAPFWEFGGPPVKIQALSEALVRLGHDVTVLTADWGLESQPERGFDRKTIERSPFGWRREENGVRSVYLPTWFQRRTLTWNPAVRRFCRTQLERFDVVHIFGLYDLLGPAVAAACKRSNIPYLVEPMGMYVPIVRSFRLKQVYHGIFGRAMLAEAKCFVATSEQEAGELVSTGLPREKIVFRRNGVYVPDHFPDKGTYRRAHGIGSDEKVILFLGRLSEKKSPDSLLKAFALLGEPLRRNARLVFAGAGQAGIATKLQKMADELGVASRVQFPGFLFREAKWAAYRDADVFVLPSQNENFGNAAAEAMAAGTPVVLTEACGIAPMLADEAGLVTPHDAAAIARAIERIFTEPGLQERLIAGCRDVTSRLGWDSPAREMESVYSKLAEDRRRVA